MIVSLWCFPKPCELRRSPPLQTSYHWSDDDVSSSNSIGGYPKGLTFGAPIGLRTDEGREDFLQYFNSAIDIPDPNTTSPKRPPTAAYPAIKRVEDTAKAYGVFIVAGAIERDGGTLYCTVIWVHPEEGLVGKRRKVSSAALGGLSTAVHILHN